MLNDQGCWNIIYVVVFVFCRSARVYSKSEKAKQNNLENSVKYSRLKLGQFYKYGSENNVFIYMIVLKQKFSAPQ